MKESLCSVSSKISSSPHHRSLFSPSLTLTALSTLALLSHLNKDIRCVVTIKKKKEKRKKSPLMAVAMATAINLTVLWSASIGCAYAVHAHSVRSVRKRTQTLKSFFPAGQTRRGFPQISAAGLYGNVIPPRKLALS